jgi:hypothetical protein
MEDAIKADITAALIADLARFDWEIICEHCGAPLIEGDDYVSNPDGCSGCWSAMTDHPSKRQRPCYAYRVGKPVTEAPLREGLCQLCNREYRGWVAASPLWNCVVRGGSINGNETYEFLCANCFMEIAEDSGIASCFQLRAATTANLETVTPSGRVWDDRDFLWK